MVRALVESMDRDWRVGTPRAPPDCEARRCALKESRVRETPLRRFEAIAAVFAYLGLPKNEFGTVGAFDVSQVGGLVVACAAERPYGGNDPPYESPSEKNIDCRD